jgi:hypothetical protein
MTVMRQRSKGEKKRERVLFVVARWVGLVCFQLVLLYFHSETEK